MKIKVALIRHGKTAGNVKGEYIGITDEPLCEQGIAELNTLKGKIPTAQYCYTSGMSRTIQTADIYYGNLNHTIEKSLNECDFGDFEKHTYEQLNGNVHYQKFLDSNGIIEFPNGENPIEFRKRCLYGFNKIVGFHKDGDEIAIVCHGGTIMSILEKITEIHVFYKWQVKNGKGYSFVYDTKLMHADNIKEI